MSEMPVEEEEEEIDEEASIDGLEDVEKSSMRMTRVTYFTLDEDEVREVLATAWK